MHRFRTSDHEFQVDVLRISKDAFPLEATLLIADLRVDRDFFLEDLPFAISLGSPVLFLPAGPHFQEKAQKDQRR